MKIRSNYFYGHEVSEYGKQCGYVDYRTLSRAFDAVLCNDVTKLFYSTISGEFTEPERINGFIDNSEAIEELREELEAIEEKQIEMIKADEEESPEYKELERLEEEKREAIEDLEREQDEQPEIYQYFIISYPGAQILQECTNEVVYYIEALDLYIWGVTHWGTSWDYVLTDIEIAAEEE